MARGGGLIYLSASDDPDFAGESCEARCRQRGEQRARTSHQTLASP